MIPWIFTGISLVLLTFLILYLLSRVARGYSEPEDDWEPPSVHYGIIDTDTCKQIIKKVESDFARSNVIGDVTVDNSRTSESAWITRDDPLVSRIVKKAQELTDKPIENFEDIQVVRYKPGTYYKAHHDACCDDNKHCKSFDAEAGQRIGTLVVYLNEDFEEGQTHFPMYGDLKLKPSPGAGIFFRPLDDTGKCHPKALHAGLPIKSGTKYICNVWIRENKFR